MSTNQYDVIGVGIGPANLALATAIMDARDEGANPSAIFLDRSPRFAWHPGMLLPGSKLQVSYLKDLATQRNPRSRYTFLNYIFEKGRIEEFINLREPNPDRDEYVDYMSWVASCAGDLLRFDSEVQALRPGFVDGAVAYLDVSARRSTGEVVSYRTKTVVIATGREPNIPNELVRGCRDRIVHTSRLLPQLATGVWPRDKPMRIAIVGGGQSAIEAACYLLKEYPQASVDIIHRGYVVNAVDDNPYVNESYYGCTIDRFYRFGQAARKRALAGVAASNFGVVERRLLDELYRHQYDGLRRGQQRVSLLHGHDVTAVQGTSDRVHYEARSVFDDSVIQRHVDGVILATGYRESLPACLEPLKPWLSIDAAGSLAIRRDYRVACDPSFAPKIFLHGTREDLHGPAELNLSTLALRAAVLFDALREAPALSHSTPIHHEPHRRHLSRGV